MFCANVIVSVVIIPVFK